MGEKDVRMTQLEDRVRVLESNLDKTETNRLLSEEEYSMQDDCDGVTFDHCPEQYPIQKTNTVNQFECEQICRTVNNCLYVKFYYFGLCELYGSVRRLEGCKITSARRETNIEKCLGVPVLSCDKMMSEECTFNDTVPTYISVWPGVKNYADCQQHCVDNLYPDCHFWSLNRTEEK